MAETIAVPPDDPLGGITEQDYLDWKHHPVSKVFRRYLADFAHSLRRDHVLRWEHEDSLDPSVEAEAKGRVRALAETVDLQFAHIKDFYTEPPTEEGDAAKIAED